MTKIGALLIALAFLSPASAQINNNTQAPISGASRVICSIRGANFNSTADQLCNNSATAPPITAWVFTSVVVANCSVSMTTAVGGVYAGAGKTGTQYVANSQTYSNLTSAALLLWINFYGAGANTTTRITGSTVYLSLTTAQGAAATCDFYAIGYDLT